MEYTVHVEWRAFDPLSQDRIFDVAQIGGVATGEPGMRELGTTMTVDASSRLSAIDEAARRVEAIVPGQLTDAEAAEVQD